MRDFNNRILKCDGHTKLEKNALQLFCMFSEKGSLSTKIAMRYAEDKAMKATAELQIVPIGSGVSVRKEITHVVEILKNYNFLVETHASGTDIEGELKEILAAVEAIHESLHKTGNVRLLSYLKLETRTDKTPTLAGKQL